jgi:hypothetical protein
MRPKPADSGEDAVLVHAADFMHQAACLLEQRQEQHAVLRVAPELRIDQAARTPQSAQRARRHALEFAVRLQQCETFEQCARCAHEHVLRHHVEQFPAGLEARIDRLHHGVVGRKQRGGDVLQQDGVQLGDHLRAAVVALHEHFGGAAGWRGLHAERSSQRFLVVEDQPVFAPAGDQVQPDPGVAHETFDPVQLARFGRRDQTARSQFGPGRAEPAGARDPLDHLQIAQPAGTFLAVRLQAVRRLLIALVAFVLLQALGLEKASRIALGRQRVAQLAEHAAGAGQQARFEQRGFDCDVARCFLDALAHRTDAVADIQTDVPQQADQHFQPRFDVRRQLRRGQEKKVDVRCRIQLAAAIATDGNQRRCTRHAGRRPEAAQGGIDRTRAVAQQALAVAVTFERFTQLLLSCRQLGTQRGCQQAQRVGTGRGIHPSGRSADVADQRRRGRAAVGNGQHLVPVVGDDHRMFPLRRQRAVARDDSPAVRQFGYGGAAGIHHRLDGEDHAGLQFHAGAGFAVVEHLRILVELATDAVTAEFPHHRKTVRFGMPLYHVTDIAQARARPDAGDAEPQTFEGDLAQPAGLLADFIADHEHAAGVAVEAVLDHRDVQVDDVTLLQRTRCRNAVAHDMIDRRADRLRERAVARRRIVERRRDGFLLIHHVVMAQPVKFFRRDAGLDMRFDEIEHL